VIPDHIIEKVKEVAVAVDVISEYVTLKKEGTNMVACCPFHEEKSASFKVDIKDNFYKCFGCTAAGNAIDFLMAYKRVSFQEAVRHLAAKYNIEIEEGAQRVYKLPAPKNVTPLSDNTLAWFKGRKISQQTIIQLGITQSLTWMYAVTKEGKVIAEEGERNVIDFNYYRGKEIVNIKYRDHLKTFRLYKDAELILYNINSLEGAHEVYAVEGEIDALTLIEAGIQKPGTAVVSVPNGANLKTNNLSYLDGPNMDLFKNIKTIYLAVDDDTAGRKLREDLANRFGKGRCKYIEWRGKKDANDVLKAYGPEEVVKCCNEAISFPITGVFSVNDYDNAITDMFRNGIPPGCGIGLEKFDKLLRFEPGWITGVTGMPSGGKSEWVDQVALSLMLRHDWKFAFYSPENDPFQLHFAKLARKLIGKSWRHMSEQEVNLVKRFLQDKMWIIKPKDKLQS
jgi:twinkle protein